MTEQDLCEADLYSCGMDSASWPGCQVNGSEVGVGIATCGHACREPEEMLLNKFGVYNPFQARAQHEY